MKKGKKLVINTFIILLMLLIGYYFCGFYISKEQCIRESLRGMYAYETEFVMEFENRDRVCTLLTDEDKKTYSIVGTRKLFFVYHADSSLTGFKIKEEDVIDVLGMYDDKIGTSIFVYRTDKSITKIEVELENGDKITLDEWKKDYVGYLQKNEMWVKGIYRAYNASGELVGELER